MCSCLCIHYDVMSCMMSGMRAMLVGTCVIAYKAQALKLSCADKNSEQAALCALCSM